MTFDWQILVAGAALIGLMAQGGYVIWTMGKLAHRVEALEAGESQRVHDAEVLENRRRERHQQLYQLIRSQQEAQSAEYGLMRERLASLETLVRVLHDDHRSLGRDRDRRD